jgi:hypothetical protein
VCTLTDHRVLAKAGTTTTSCAVGTATTVVSAATPTAGVVVVIDAAISTVEK